MDVTYWNRTERGRGTLLRSHTHKDARVRVCVGIFSAFSLQMMIIIIISAILFWHSVTHVVSFLCIEHVRRKQKKNGRSFQYLLLLSVWQCRFRNSKRDDGDGKDGNEQLQYYGSRMDRIPKKTWSMYTAICPTFVSMRMRATKVWSQSFRMQSDSIVFFCCPLDFNISLSLTLCVCVWTVRAMRCLFLCRVEYTVTCHLVQF